MWNASYVHGASYDSTQAKIFFQLRQARGETRDDTTELDGRALLMLLHPSRIRVSTRSPCRLVLACVKMECWRKEP